MHPSDWTNRIGEIGPARPEPEQEERRQFSGSSGQAATLVAEGVRSPEAHRRTPDDHSAG
jgi:hypothetical protein